MGRIKRTLLAIGGLFQLLELAAYVIALILGIRWLALRFDGRTDAPDELERGGLWVLAFLIALVVGGVVRLILRARAATINRSSSPPQTSANTSGTSRAGRAASG